MTNFNTNQIESPKHALQPTNGETITSFGTRNTYTIGELLGEGSFGIVYSCQDTWGNDLAVKVLKPINTYDQVKRNAENEFRKLLELRHPYITYVFDAFEYRNTFYIVTEKCHCPISNLFNLSNFSGQAWLKPIAKQILQAVHYVHINNYVHPDIHEGNIFTTFIKDGMVPDKDKIIQFKLGDLGITKLLPEVGIANTRAQWMLPPEVLNSSEFGPVDSRIDIYHLGLLFLQMGHSKRLRFTKEEILEGKPREMALELPTQMSYALEKSLRRHVNFRTTSALEFWQDLNNQSSTSHLSIVPGNVISNNMKS
ncbi:MAG: serine/threonine-protein kinase [gamma proteobacterium symbiont of Ctena orbiculata]